MNALGFKERSTIYNEIEGFGIIEDSIVQKNKQLRKENVTKEIKKVTKSDIIQSFKELLGNMHYIQTTIEEYIIHNNEEFVNLQHEFLDGGYIAIDIKDNILKIVTYAKKAYIIDMAQIDKKIYGVIFSSYVPRKICFDTRLLYKSQYTSELTINHPYDISHIVKMYCNQKVGSLKELIELFTNDANDNENTLLYNIFQIKNTLNDLLERFSLMSLLNKEMKIISIVSKAEVTGIPFSQEAYDDFLYQLNENYNTAIKLVVGKLGEEKLGADIKPLLNNKDKLINLLHSNDLSPTFNKDFWADMKNTDLQGLIIANELINKYDNCDLTIKEDRMFLEYELYDEYGNIKSNFSLDGRYVIAKEGKLIVTGSYSDLYFRIFASLSNIDFIINSVNNDTFITALTLEAFKMNTPTSRFLARNFLKAYIEGYIEPQDLEDYFFNKLDTKFSNIGKFQNTFNENSCKIIKFIKRFYRNQSRDKRFCFNKEPALHQYIKMTEADILKSAIILVSETISIFNETNKYNINLVGIQNGRIILEADEGALNIAVDTLNRKLTQAFDMYVRNVQGVCNVVASSSLKL